MTYHQGCDVSKVNLFSSPNVTHWEKNTGDDTHNNARIIQENMVRFLKSTPQVSHIEVS